MNPKISVIIPVYNVEKHLEKCLSSILNQTLDSLEVIAINDGSTDRSLEILEHFSNQDQRLKVINQVNQGVSAARNKGLSLAQGEYIGFVDSDDYIEDTMYEKLYECVNQYNCDVVVANVFDETSESSTVSLDFETGKVEVVYNQMDKFLKEHFFKFGHAVWHKLFRRQLIEENQLKFYSYQEVSSEDMLFNLFILSCAETIYYLNEPLYHYVIHESSLTKSHHAKCNMVLRSQKTIQLVQNQYHLKQIRIPIFLDYLTYTELLRSLSKSPSRINSLKQAIRQYSELQTFKSTMKRLSSSQVFKEYFINEKGSYSKLYEGFDRIFSWLCLCQCYYLAANLHSIRLKRANRLIKEGN